jgi:UDP-glucose 6-dehydrogenase
MKNFKKLFRHKNIIYAKNEKTALQKADACIIQTAWEEFKNLRPKDFKVMKTPVVIDGRRTFDNTEIFAKNGMVYLGIGWKYNKF